jgi:Xaa-Pro aminopeptidase
MQFPSRVLAERLKNLRNKLQQKELGAFLVSSQQNRYYFSGWQGDFESGYLLVTQKEAFVITDSRYTEEVSYKIRGWGVKEYSGNIYKAVGELIKDLALSRIGIESHDFSVFSLRELRKNTKGVKIVPVAHLVEDLRVVKDKFEISLLKRAAEIADSAFVHALKFIKVGMKEKDIAVELESYMKKMGAQKGAWDPFIVAAGENSSMVHYPAGERRIKKGDQILLDWGAVYQGYHSDISRVVFVGKPSSEQVKIYNLVLQAQKKGLEKVKEGTKGKTVDEAARNFLKKETKQAFGHSVGHGVGLEIHELPRVNFKANKKLEKNMVITVEPGVYIPGWGGVRIEDTVLVTKHGYDTLTKATKNLSRVIL